MHARVIWTCTYLTGPDQPPQVTTEAALGQNSMESSAHEDPQLGSDSARAEQHGDPSVQGASPCGDPPAHAAPAGPPSAGSSGLPPSAEGGDGGGASGGVSNPVASPAPTGAGQTRPEVAGSPARPPPAPPAPRAAGGASGGAAEAHTGGSSGKEPEMLAKLAEYIKGLGGDLGAGWTVICHPRPPPGEGASSSGSAGAISYVPPKVRTEIQLNRYCCVGWVSGCC